MTAFCLVFVGVFVVMYVSQGRKLDLLECRLWENRVSKRDLVKLSLRRERRLYLSSNGRLYWKKETGSVRFIGYLEAVLMVRSSCKSYVYGVVFKPIGVRA